MIKIIYFAGAKEMVGKGEEMLKVDNLTVKQLLEWIGSSYPAFDQTGMQVAINEEYAMLDDKVKTGDVCAIIPPVSGG